MEEAYQREQDREDARFAMLASVIANLARAKGKPAYKVSDFMPRKRPKTQKELLSKVRLFAAAFK